MSLFFFVCRVWCCCRAGLLRTSGARISVADIIAHYPATAVRANLKRWTVGRTRMCAAHYIVSFDNSSHKRGSVVPISLDANLALACNAVATNNYRLRKRSKRNVAPLQWTRHIWQRPASIILVARHCQFIGRGVRIANSFGNAIIK
eukprot:COSAG02_NODE_3242_length_7111_cov_2.874786_4_plen_147_part_00